MSDNRMRDNRVRAILRSVYRNIGMNASYLREAATEFAPTETERTTIEQIASRIEDEANEIFKQLERLSK